MNKRFRIATALLLVVALFAFTLAGCSTPAEEPAADQPATEAVAAFPVTVTDDAGREVTVDAEPMRIVSLAPANTEIVAELGLLDRLVGVTSFCDYPAEVAGIEKVGDFVGPNIEAVAAVEPDLVLATTGVQADVIEQLEAIGAIVVAVDPQNLEQLYAAIEMVGAVTGATDEAAATVAEMVSGVDFIKETVAQVDAVPCFIEIAQDPLFTAGSGTLLDDLLSAAGGTNVVTDAGWVAYSLEQLLEDDPTVYLATLGSMSDPDALAARPGFDSLSAVKNGRVAVLDDNLVSRPGPRVVEGLGQIAVALHPQLFAE